MNFSRNTLTRLLSSDSTQAMIVRVLTDALGWLLVFVVVFGILCLVNMAVNGLFNVIELFSAWAQQ